jgi:hypothetical protein
MERSEKPKMVIIHAYESFWSSVAADVFSTSCLLLLLYFSTLFGHWLADVTLWVMVTVIFGFKATGKVKKFYHPLDYKKFVEEHVFTEDVLDECTKEAVRRMVVEARKNGDNPKT